MANKKRILKDPVDLFVKIERTLHGELIVIARNQRRSLADVVREACNQLAAEHRKTCTLFTALPASLRADLDKRADREGLTTERLLGRLLAEFNQKELDQTTTPEEEERSTIFVKISSITHAKLMRLGFGLRRNQAQIVRDIIVAYLAT